MRGSNSIITIGLSPAWDITCRGQNLDWGLHEYVDEQTVRPAGKALNVSNGLAWMGQTNIAAGLWGRDDYGQMLKAMSALEKRVKVELTAVDGSTRRNITVVDTLNAREMHLRNRSELASARALRKLHDDLKAMVHKDSVCVFAGTMPESELLADVIRIIEFCRSRSAKIVLDTSGPALSQIVRSGAVWLIKPNVEELSELLGEQIRDEPASLSEAGRKLLDRVEVVLISRGRRGGIVVTKEGAWRSRCVGRGRVLSTVGCGDYLLAGFLKGLKDTSDAASALKTAIKVATAKAWGWTETKTWPRVKRQIRVESDQV